MIEAHALAVFVEDDLEAIPAKGDIVFGYFLYQVVPAIVWIGLTVILCSVNSRSADIGHFVFYHRLIDCRLVVELDNALWQEVITIVVYPAFVVFGKSGIRAHGIRQLNYCVRFFFFSHIVFDVINYINR
ncbi:hypothetical protein [Dysgonomonas mossii]|uniref:hypothetical protein n=1 Tax=Dysgonomonas mossii TaxID=163665 RepID=UPI003994C327